MTAHRFWDLIARKYARDPVADPEAYERKLSETRMLLRPDDRVLEFGCGTGTTALRHAPHVKEIVAIDISARMIGIAREKAQSAHVTNVEFRQASFDTFDAAPGSFNMVMAHSILHLIPDHRAAIEQSFNLLAPGGVFVSSTACLGEMGWVFRKILPLGRTLRGYFPLLTVFSAEELRADITNAGFVIESHWQKSSNTAAFIIARRPATAANDP